MHVDDAGQDFRDICSPFRLTFIPRAAGVIQPNADKPLKISR